MDGQEIYFCCSWRNRDDLTKLDEFSHDQIGGDIAFRLVEMFTRLRYEDDLIFDETFKEFTANNCKETNCNK